MKGLIAAASAGVLLVIGGCSTTLLVGAAGLGTAAALTCTAQGAAAGAGPAGGPGSPPGSGLNASAAGAAGAAGTAVPDQPDLADLPAEVGDYGAEQLRNAATIMAAGAALGLDAHGQSLGVMTAIGESTLLNVDRGDAVGPDSRGLFQQRANGAWGSYEERMDPFTAATNFFRALQQVDGWRTLSPTQAAHRVQRNADPDHYAPFWDDAVQIVSALSQDPALAGQLRQLGQMSGDQPCGAAEADTAPAVALNGWARPADGPVTSDFGPRTAPTAGASTNHRGIDFGGGCGAEIYAAAAGRVVESGPATGFGNWIVLEHDAGMRTVYGHMQAQDLLVDVGEAVTAGQTISRIGDAGVSTACHLHFEVHDGATPINPASFLEDQGAVLT